MKIDKNVIAALPLDQQLALLDDLRFRLDKKTKSTRVLASRQVWSALETDVWHALARELQARLHQETQPLAVFTKTFGVENYRQAVASIETYMDAACGEKLPRLHTLALLRTIFGCVIDNMLDRDIPVAPTSVLRLVGHIPQIVNAAFPGYAAARLLHRLVPMMDERAA